MPELLLMGTRKNIQLHVPDLDRILGLKPPEEVIRRPEFGPESPPCPLNLEDGRIEDFLVIKTNSNQAEMIFSPRSLTKLANETMQLCI
jgi:hypothetical protein